jgi:predicted nucleic acid-binding protein
VLRQACLRGRVTAQGAQAIVERITSLPIDVDRQPVRPGEILALALRFGLTSYDAAYLELALRLQAPLATTDAALRDAALASGVGIIGMAEEQ